MKRSITQIQKARRYSEDVKRSLVRDFESGRYSILELSLLHGIHKNNLYRWVYKFSTFNQRGYRVVESNESTMSKVRHLEQRIRELEQLVGQKQIQIDYLEKMIEVAKGELQIDIKKNFGTPHSGGSGKTAKA